MCFPIAHLESCRGPKRCGGIMSLNWKRTLPQLWQFDARLIQLSSRRCHSVCNRIILQVVLTVTNIVRATSSSSASVILNFNGRVCNSSRDLSQLDGFVCLLTFEEPRIVQNGPLSSAWNWILLRMEGAQKT